MTFRVGTANSLDLDHTDDKSQTSNIKRSAKISILHDDLLDHSGNIVHVEVL